MRCFLVLILPSFISVFAWGNEPDCSSIKIQHGQAKFAHGRFPIIWQDDINSDGQMDFLSYTESCEGKPCMAGVYVQCKDSQFRLVLEPDHGREDLVAMARKGSGKWKKLTSKESKKKLPARETAPTTYDDLDDPLSAERLINEKRFAKRYESSGKGSPALLAGEYEYKRGQYRFRYRDEDVAYLLELIELGDYEAAQIIFSEFLLKEGYPHKRLPQSKTFLRKLFKTGFLVPSRSVDNRLLQDPLAEKFYIRANLANIETEFLKRRLSKDPELRDFILRYSADNLSYMPKSIRGKAVHVETALRANRRAIEFVEPHFLKDADLLKKWCKDFKISLRYADPKVLANRGVALACVSARPLNYKFLTKALKRDRQIVRLALSAEGHLISFVPKPLRKDLDLVKVALKSDPEAKKFLDMETLEKLKKSQ